MNTVIITGNTDKITNVNFHPLIKPIISNDSKNFLINAYVKEK